MVNGQRLRRAYSSIAYDDAKDKGYPLMIRLLAEELRGADEGFGEEGVICKFTSPKVQPSHHHGKGYSRCSCSL